MPLRILFVGTLPPHPGGAAVLNGQLLAGCAALGHSICALGPINANALGNRDEFADRQPDIAVTRYTVPCWRPWPGAAHDSAYRTLEAEQLPWQFRALINRRRPDLVVIGHEGFAWDVPHLARAAGLPCVMLFHSGATLELFGTKLRASLLTQLHNTDLVITVAEHLTRELRRLGIERVRAIPNFVDVDRFSPRPRDRALLDWLRIAESDRVVMHVSNLKANKRPLDLVHSARQALLRDPKLKYVIVGDGEMGVAMEDLCKQAGLGERFRFAGWIDHHRLPDYLNLADVVAMPSETEGLALVYLETQACARVLLASDIPAAREVIRDGYTGLLFRKGDVDDLTAKILRAADDPALRNAIGRRARQQVQSHSLDKAVAAYVESFESVCRKTVTGEARN